MNNRIQKLGGKWYQAGTNPLKAFTIVGKANVCNGLEDDQRHEALMIVHEGREACQPDVILADEFYSAAVYPEYLFDGDLVYEESCGKILGIYRVSNHETEGYVRLLELNPETLIIKSDVAPITAHAQLLHHNIEVQVPTHNHNAMASKFHYASLRKIAALQFEANRNKARLLAHQISNLITAKFAYNTDKNITELGNTTELLREIIEKLKALPDVQDK